MISRLRNLVIACAVLLIFSAAMFVRGQAASNITNLRDQLRQRYDIVALREGLGLVPRQPIGDVRLIEIRNGGVAINGDAVTAREARAQLAKDAELILRLTYLDSAALRQLAGADSAATPSTGDTEGNTNQPEPTPAARTQLRRGDLVRIGGGVTVGRDEVVQGDVVAIGGPADINGEVARDVTVVGGSLNLGPEALVRGDVTVVGGTLNRSPGARVSGKVDNVAFGEQFPFNRRLGRSLVLRRPFSRVGSLLGTVLRMTLLLLSALVIVALGGRLVESIANRAATEPLRAGLVGLLAEVLFLPLLVITIVVLAVSIVGIPLLLLVPFGIVLVVVLMLIGFAGIAFHIGRLISGRLGIRRGPYASAALGIVAVVGLTLIARIIALAGGFTLGLVVAGAFAAVGYLAEYVAWTVGIGALILTWLATRRPPAPAAGVAAPGVGEAHAE
jgi:hypothetical protein